MSKRLDSPNFDVSRSSLLSQANEAQRLGNFSLALNLYRQLASKLDGVLADQINLNIARVQKKIGMTNETSQGIQESTANKKDLNLDEVLKSEIDDVKPYFNVEYYINQYEDIKLAGIDPVLHYCMQGWKELRNPHPDFSTKTYLELHQDVDEAKVNPFWHYIVAGKSEGRALRHPGGVKLEILKKLPDLDTMVKNWRKLESPSNRLTYDVLLDLLATGIGVGARKSRLIICVSHDNYRVAPGGVQLCIQREEQLAMEAGYVYVNIHPWQPLPILSKSMDPLLQILINGTLVGQIEASIFSRVIEEMKEKKNTDFALVIHSLLGHSLARVAELTRQLKENSLFFWLHDFFSLCPSYALQRNNVSYCDSPTPRSNSCSICIYGEERLSHIEQMEKFFSSNKINILSPSGVALSLWKSKSNYAISSEYVIPHRTVEWKREKVYDGVGVAIKEISVAYLGGPVFHKGWFVFRDVMRALATNKNFIFYHFGKNSEEIEGLRLVDVHVRSDNYDAMIEAIDRENIDFVLHWANWPETFSFTAFEAIAGGANVLTSSISGNVAEMVRKSNRGSIFRSPDDLVSYLQSSEVVETVRKIRDRRRNYRRIVSISEMTLTNRKENSLRP